MSVAKESACERDTNHAEQQQREDETPHENELGRWSLRSGCCICHHNVGLRSCRCKLSRAAFIIADFGFLFRRRAERWILCFQVL